MKACSAAFAPSACHANGADRANCAHIAIPAHIAFLAPMRVSALREVRARRASNALREARARRASNALREVRARRAIRSRRAFRAHRAIRVRRVRSRCGVTLRSAPIRSALLTPATVGAAAPADGLQGGASAAPRGSSTSSLSLPPTGHLLSTSDKRTCITPLVTAFTTSRTRIVDPKPHTVASLISSRSNVPKK